MVWPMLIRRSGRRHERIRVATTPLLNAAVLMVVGIDQFTGLAGLVKKLLNFLRRAFYAVAPYRFNTGTIVTVETLLKISHETLPNPAPDGRIRREHICGYWFRILQI